MERPLYELPVLVCFYILAHALSIRATWAWKYRHLDYPNGFPAITGVNTGVQLFQGILLAIFVSICSFFIWWQNESGGILWLIAAVTLWAIQLFLISRHRMTWEEYYEIKSKQNLQN